VEYLRGWLDFTDDPVWQTNLYRDMADYAMQAGHLEASLGWIAQAQTLAEGLGDANTLHITKHIHANVLMAAGCAKAALGVMPAPERSISVQQQFYEASLRIEVLLALGERTEAQEWLNGVYGLCREYSLSTERADDLAGRLK
jgi:hypothetical protein